MKKYKQILAGLLAMNLAVYVMPTGMVQISASVQNQKSENTDTEKTETGETESTGTTDSVDSNTVDNGTEDAAAVQTASEEVAVADTSEDFSSDDIADTPDTAPDNNTTETPGDAASDSDTTETPGDNASDNNNASTPETPAQDNTNPDLPAENPDDNTSSDLTDSSETLNPDSPTPSNTTEDLFTDGTQPEEPKAAADGGDVAVQAGENDSTIDLTSLKGYKKDTNTFDVTSEKELILLSHCDAKQIEAITINLKISGNPDITANNKIKQGDNISEFFAGTTTISDDESMQEDAENVVASDDNSNNSQQEEISQNSTDTVQSENDSAETAESAQITDTEDVAETEVPVQPENTQDNNSGQSEDTQNDISVQAETVTATQDYTFQGIGTESVPFQGKIIGSVNTIKIDHTFFGGLSSKATVTVGADKTLPLIWCGDETKPMLAEVYQFDQPENTSDGGETNNHTLPVKIQGDSAGTMGSLIGTVQEAEDVTDQTLTIGQNVVDYTSAKEVKAVLDSGNAGLICNTLKSGNISLNGYKFPGKAYTIQSTAKYASTDESAAGNAGGFIGMMKNNTTLKIESAVTISDNTEIISDKGNAGGLVGLMEQGAKITTAENTGITLNNPKITGGVSAGGVAGEATDVTFTDSDLTPVVEVKNPTITATGTATGAAAGGFVGKYTLNAANLRESAGNLQLSDKIVITEPTLTVNNSGLAGGYFGHLNLQGEVSYTIGSADNNSKKTITPTYKDCIAEATGAIAGKVTSDTIKSTLLIQNMTVQATNSSNTGIQYHGGLVGEVGTKDNSSAAVYLNIKNVDVNINNPFCTDSNGNGFGGIVGLLAKGSILKAEDNITVTTSENTAINRGGGLVGYAEKSVLNVSGTTDLSGVRYGQNTGKDAKAGWLVGEQDCALIYANGDGNGNGWTYIRGKELNTSKQAMNNIGNYGQIVRLKSGQSVSKLRGDLITITDDHTVSYRPQTPVALSGDDIAIGSEDAFALLSIVWNSRGYFGDVAGITSDNFDTTSPRSKNIILKADIDLTGSGVVGLSRDVDVKTDEDTYAGTFEGGNHTITLSTGETFGYKQDQKETLASEGDGGYGEVIAANRDGTEYHSRQGLFAKVKKAEIKNLTISGKVNISNAGKDILAGGIAGEVAGTSTEFPKTSNVTVNETINADCAANTVVAAGGFYGGSYSGEPEFGAFNEYNTLNTASATINISNCTDSTDDTKIYAGELIGEVNSWNYKLKAYNVKISGTITTDEKKRAYVGGLVGIIRNGGTGDTRGTHWVEIKGVVFDQFTINAPNVTEMCGGLFGSIWENVGLYFMGKQDGDDGTSVKLDVTEAAINAPNAKDVGGLAYRSNGRWEIRDHGIALKKLTINAQQNVGLLVCKGTKGTEKVAGTDTPFDALYLNTTKYWESSYEISKENVSITTTKNGAFDEFVAYTTPSAGEINDNGKNGVISIATKEEKGERVGVDATNECTTYQNRTEYGKSHQTNACSRYYYDLDRCLTDMAKGSYANKTIDTPQELLLWSVHKYASQNIRTYFTKSGNTNLSDITTSETNMPWSIGNTESLDMSKYSYYPIKFEGGSVNLQGTTLIFNNEKIETVERNSLNKSTQGTNDAHTQHYEMHCGLFLTYQSNGGVFTIRDVSFAGSIGKINNNASGVLVSDFASGYLDNSTGKTIAINITNITLNGLKVTRCGEDYAPLLINNISDRTQSSYTYGYSTLSINGVTVENYESGKAVASSLIGNVGSYKAKQINLTFQNIVLPDKRADGTTGIFSHATLLEHFSYSKDDNASGATYNFYSTDDWNGADHKHQVTYGKEITGSTEFTDLQKWYYDESTYMTDDGLVYENVNSKNFDASGYLPYVCEPYNTDAAKCMHEIKVNQRVVDITNGCGTYGHPYRITKEEEMKILSDYMATGEPRKDWRVTVAKTQDDVHTSNSDIDYTSSEDVTYQYDGTNYWVQVVNKATDGKDDWQEVPGKIKLGKNFMRDYLLNAYYDIRGTVVKGSDTAGTEESGNDSGKERQLILNDFKGFGTAGKPFRGVITSTNNTTLVLKGNNTGNGLIPYSYGSVVKNLKISYEGTGKTLEYKEEDIEKTGYYPQVCFGGVIGCVLGGDNIIDNVTVDTQDGWNLTLAGDKEHLIQVGGYVGSVSGGGVIFRNMTGKTGLTDNMISNPDTEISVKENAKYSLYVNPYVGRVLDGFAFYESDSGSDKLENTDKNYKINTLLTGDTGCVDATDNTVTVKDAQGLLILSAVINSGAGSGGISNAYSTKGNADNTAVSYPTENSSNLSNTTYYFGGRYGKVRNASYSNIGENVDDATLSENEDKALPGSKNLPYLISKYCNSKAKIFSISTNSNAEIVLSSEQTAGFDMTTYGNGYQGIAARYVSNAVRGHQANNIINHPEGVVPELKSFDGNNKIVTVNMQVREYADDDFHAASLGGIFNVLRVNSSDNSKGKNSNLTIGKNSENTNSVISLEYYDENGSAKNVSKADWSSSEDVGIGALAGSLVGYTDTDGNRDITIEKIQLDGLTIKSPASAGGVVGNIGKPVANKEPKSNAKDMAVLLQPENSQIVYGTAFNECSYADIQIEGKYAAGGFAGYIGGCDKTDTNSHLVADPATTVKGKTDATGKNSSISGTDNLSTAGGLFGYVKTRVFINMDDAGKIFTNNKTILENIKITAKNIVGGCIGNVDGRTYGINSVMVNGNESTISLEKNEKGTFYAGGIVGYAKGINQWWGGLQYVGWVSNCSVENVQINNAEIAASKDYTGTEKLLTNYICGGITGQSAGGKTRIENCTVTSGKIYGSIAGGITGQTDSLMQFSKCVVKGSSETSETELKGFSTAGGILGFWQKQDVTIQGCEVQYLDIEGKDWGVGTFIGDADSKDVLGCLYLFNCSAQNSEVTAAGNKDGGGGRWPCVGGIIGNLRNTIKASNILFSDVTLSAEAGVHTNANSVFKGLLFGSVVGGPKVNIAGISIQNIPESNKTWSLAGSGSVTSDNDYIAFADYSGTATDTSTTSQTVKDEDLLGYKNTAENNVTTEVASPYVVTSPKNATLKLYESESDTNSKYLYGDGVSWSTSLTMKAREVYENRTNVKEGHYAYSNISEENFDFNSALSTFNANNPTASESTDNTDQITPTPSGSAGTGQTTGKATDFPVLQIGSGSADTVTAYLDIITNGAFSAANNMNTTGNVHVKAQSSIYKYENGKFIKGTAKDEETVAFKVNTASDGKITFSTTANYDNTQNRFNLLTVTFTETDADGTAHHYNVFVPVLVRRMLEIDFKASLTYGTDFKNTDYDARITHVLESFGSSITGYLTYTYNSAAGTYTDYGWESYINAGGNVMEMKKSIRFEQSANLPEGTQLSLVDCRDGKVYYYTASGSEERDSRGINIPLSSFKNSEGESYQEPSISELIGAEASKAGNKLFVKVDANGEPLDATVEEGKKYSKPTVKIGKEYFRLAENGETAEYSITVNESSLKNGTKSNVKENYYLVITVPENVTGSMNGSIQTSISSTIPKRINYRTTKLENNKFVEDLDGHSNTASTYLLSSGYKQTLTETGSRGLSYKLSMSDSKLRVDATDTITFPNDQVYNSSDELYMRFGGGLQKTIGSNTSGTSTSAEQFPSGTTGTASFYVYTEKDNVKTYYTYEDGSWKEAGTAEKIAVSYPWTSTGGNMELPLSSNGKDAVNLQGLRDLVKNGQNSGNSTFYVEVKMDATIPGAGLDVIPESKTTTDGNPEDYVKLTYYSQLSTEKQSLTYSSNRATAPSTTTEYYREEPSGVELTYDADKIDQLGINLLDLQSAYLDTDEQNSYIDTTATYDLSAMKNLKDTLKNSSGIKFTLSLMPKNTSENGSNTSSASGTTWKEEYGSALTKAGDYLSVDLRSQGSGVINYDKTGGTWSWTVPQNSYYDTNGDQITTSSVFDGGKLRQAIRLKVNVSNVETAGHFYSNYKVVLTAEILDKDSKTINDTHKDDNIIYTLAKIKPEFVDSQTSGQN